MFEREHQNFQVTRRSKTPATTQASWPECVCGRTSMTELSKAFIPFGVECTGNIFHKISFPTSRPTSNCNFNFRLKQITSGAGLDSFFNKKKLNFQVGTQTTCVDPSAGKTQLQLILFFEVEQPVKYRRERFYSHACHSYHVQPIRTKIVMRTRGGQRSSLSTRRRFRHSPLSG